MTGAHHTYLYYIYAVQKALGFYTVIGRILEGDKTEKAKPLNLLAMPFVKGAQGDTRPP
jgi:hypothetical protein